MLLTGRAGGLWMEEGDGGWENAIKEEGKKPTKTFKIMEHMPSYNGFIQWWAQWQKKRNRRFSPGT